MKREYLFSVILFILLTVFFSYGATVSHRTLQVTADTFQQGAYYFPNNLKIGSTNGGTGIALEATTTEASTALRLRSGTSAFLDVRPESSGGFRTVFDTVNNRHILIHPGTSGFVGVNTNTPVARLHLGSGSLRADGSICFGASNCRNAWPGQGAFNDVNLAASGNYRCPAGRAVTRVTYDASGDDHLVAFRCSSFTT